MKRDKIIVPIKKPAPDFPNFLEVVVKGKDPQRPLVMEYLIDEEVRRYIGVKLLGQQWVDLDLSSPEQRQRYFLNYIDFWQRMGYDYVRYEENVGFVGKGLLSNDISELSRGKRGWIDEGIGSVSSWEEFEKYPWPDPERFDYSAYEIIASNLPEGIGFIVSHAGGVFEHCAENVLGFEGLFTLILENPELVKAVFERVGSIIYRFYQYLLEIEGIGAVFQGDDMGFRSGTFLAPEVLRKLVLKWHKAYAELAHSRGLPYFLHSCGNVLAIMDDLIDYVGIDGKHSNEDAIIPVVDFKARYGTRIAVLGGVDMNVLSQADEATLRAYVKNIMNSCMPHGQFALGSGNSIPNYIPVKNYLAMLDEALSWRP